MRKLNKGKEAKELAKTVARILLPYKAFLKSITTDNGLEFACHEYITKKLGGYGLLHRSVFILAKRVD